MSNLESSTLITAAIGVTVGVISVASMYLYQRFIEKRQYKVQNHNLELINQRIGEVQEELETLSQQQKRRKRSIVGNRKHTSSSNVSTFVSTENDVDTFSTAGTGIADDEFFDCSDTEEATGDIESRKRYRESETIQLLEVELMKISAQEKTEEQIAEDVYYKLQELIKLYPNNVDIIWRFANACYTYMNHFSDIEHKKKIIREGLKACDKFLDIDNADLHKWYAILTRALGKYLPLLDRMRNGSVFKKHIMIALRVRPRDSDLHHLLGRFIYEVSNLTSFEKKVATKLFSESSNVSYEEAIESFERAEEFAIEPNLENHLFLSKSYMAINRYEKAIYWLHRIGEKQAVTKKDQNIQSEANELLEKYFYYF